MEKYKTKYYEILSKNRVTRDIISKCRNSYNKNKYFFKKDSATFKIIIAYTEEEFKRKTGKIYQKWLKGISLEGKIVIRSPELLKKCYKKYGGTSSFDLILAHEMAHIFERQINIHQGPYWICEGLAMYIAKQIPGKTYRLNARYSSERLRYLMFYRWIINKTENEMYIPHYKGITFLIKSFGKTKVLRLLDSYKKNMRKKDFEKKFMKIFEITYKEFLNIFIEDFIKKRI